MTTRDRFDVIVLGVGGMGAAALYHLAARGLRVIGIERDAVPSLRGSSVGQTRIIRKAYFEDPRYVPLLHRSYELWNALRKRLEELFDDLSDDDVESDHTITVHERKIKVTRESENVIWFDFAALCDGPRSPADYVAIASEYQSVIIANVPVFGVDAQHTVGH